MEAEHTHNHSEPPNHLSDLRFRRDQEHIRTWDNWYCPIATEDLRHLMRSVSGNTEALDLIRCGQRIFAVGFLNAPREYYDGEHGPNQHHFHSRLGTALTADFKRFVTLNTQALVAESDESSIWSGSFARGPRTANGEPQYFFFYTCRAPLSPFGLSQSIRVAVTVDFVQFSRLSETLTADARWYEENTMRGDTAIHAFRDPYPIQVEGQDYLLISAKSKFLPAGKIGEIAGANGIIAVYRINFEEGRFNVSPTSLCFAGGKPEMEVASMYFDTQTHEYVLCYSAHHDTDYLQRIADQRGLPVGTIHESGVFYEARIANLPDLLRNPPTRPVWLDPKEVPGMARNSYANRWIPELGGRSLGFDEGTGEPSGDGPVRPSYQSILSEFRGNSGAESRLFT